MYHMDELVLANRSFRAFDESVPITEETMTELVDLARRGSSGRNLQPLRYRILSSPEDIGKMLENCRFAPSLGKQLPPENEKPTGFILIFSDSEAASPAGLALKDTGIAAATILFAAVERGFGGCMLGSFDPARLGADFEIPARYTPVLAIALGKPAETVVLTDARNGSLNYYRDEAGIHYVPKRTLAEVLI